MSVSSGIESLHEEPQLAANFIHWRVMPASAPAFAPFPEQLDARLRDALRRRDIGSLYTHQAEAVGAVLA